MAKDKPGGRQPDRASLQEAALRHLARFAATEAGLRRVLERRILRWARVNETDDGQVAAAMTVAAEVVLALTEAGAVDDAAFAAARSARLMRSGRSRRATAAHLAAKGIRPEIADAALPEPERELPAAVIYARKRRMGPFRTVMADEAKAKELAALARAGFSRDVAERALSMDADEAEALALATRQER